MSDERTEDPQDEPVEAERRRPGPQDDREVGEASTAPAAQPRTSDSDTTA